MHDKVRRQTDEDSLNRIRDNGRELGSILGIEDAEEKISPSYVGKVRRDPLLVRMYDLQAQADFLDEALEKLRALDISGEAPVTSLEELKGVSPTVKDKLNAAGYYSLDDIRAASEEELTEIDGIGPAKAKDLKEQAQ